MISISEKDALVYFLATMKDCGMDGKKARKAMEEFLGRPSQLEDAQGEIRALLVNEQNLRERVKELEEFLAQWQHDGSLQSERSRWAFREIARALLERQK